MVNHTITANANCTITPSVIENPAVGDTVTVINNSSEIVICMFGSNWGWSSSQLGISAGGSGVTTLNVMTEDDCTASVGFSSSSVTVTLVLGKTRSLNLPVRIADRWRNAKPYVRTGGTWQDPVWSEVTKAWMKVDGVWKRLNCPIVGPDLSDCMYLTSTSSFTFTMSKVRDIGGRDPKGTIYYYSDSLGSMWTRYTEGETLNLPANGVIYLWNPLNDLNHTSKGYWNISLTGRVSVGGDITSLVNLARGEDAQGVTFYKLFENCTGLVDASDLVLPYTEIPGATYSHLFYGCTSLTSAPALPATTLGRFESYRGMFRGCTSLVTPPSLPATTLGYYCYAEMFYGCISLTSAPTLSAQMVTGCYHKMFYGCSSLKVSANGGNAIFTYSTEMSSSVQDMFTGTGGVISGTPAVGSTYYTYTHLWETYAVTSGTERHSYLYASNVSTTLGRLNWCHYRSSAPSITSSSQYDFTTGSGATKDQIGNITSVNKYMTSNSDSIKTTITDDTSSLNYTLYYAYTKSRSGSLYYTYVADIYAIASTTATGIGAYQGIVTASSSSAYPKYGVSGSTFYICKSMEFAENTGLTTSGSTQALTGWCVSDYIPISDCSQITIDIGGTASGYSGICEYDANKNFVDYWGAGSNPRTINLTGGTNTKYVKVMMSMSAIDSTYLRDNTHNVYLFRGKNI